LIYTNRICLACVGIFFLMLAATTATGHSMDSAPLACTQSWVTCTAGGIIIWLNIRYIQKSVSLNDEDQESMSHSVLRQYDIPDMTLEDILEDRPGFESFMKHLVQEFSVENLLFVAEVQQFRKTLNYEPTDKEIQDQDVPTLRLKWLPLSVGLKNDSPWLRAQYIYAKFVCKTALHQVNISHRVWTECTRFFPELSGLNDTNNVAALPTKGGKAHKSHTPRDYNYYYRNSVKYSISSTNYNTSAYLDLPDSKKKQLMEEKKKSVASNRSHTPRVNRRIKNRSFRALSEKYLKRNKNKKLKKRQQHVKSPTDRNLKSSVNALELLETPNMNDEDIGIDDDLESNLTIRSQHVVRTTQDEIELDYPSNTGSGTGNNTLSPTNASKVRISNSQSHNMHPQLSPPSVITDDDTLDTNNTHRSTLTHTPATDVTMTVSEIEESQSEQELVSFKYELYHVFDDAEREVWLLMKDSLTRYQQTETYEKMAIGKALRSRNGRKGTATTRTHRGGSVTSTYGVGEFWKNLRSHLSISTRASPRKDTLTERRFFGGGGNKSGHELRAPLLTDETSIN